MFFFFIKSDDNGAPLSESSLTPRSAPRAHTHTHTHTPLTAFSLLLMTLNRYAYLSELIALDTHIVPTLLSAHSFRVTCSHAGRHAFTSKEIEFEAGEDLLTPCFFV
jgi:hypothetical protein